MKNNLILLTVLTVFFTTSAWAYDTMEDNMSENVKENMEQSHDNNSSTPNEVEEENGFEDQEMKAPTENGNEVSYRSFGSEETTPNKTVNSNGLDPVQEKIREEQEEDFVPYAEDKAKYEKETQPKDMERDHDFLLEDHPIQEEPLDELPGTETLKSETDRDYLLKDHPIEEHPLDEKMVE